MNIFSRFTKLFLSTYEKARVCQLNNPATKTNVLTTFSKCSYDPPTKRSKALQQESRVDMSTCSLDEGLIFFMITNWQFRFPLVSVTTACGAPAQSWPPGRRSGVALARKRSGVIPLTYRGCGSRRRQGRSKGDDGGAGGCGGRNEGGAGRWDGRDEAGCPNR